MSQIEDSAPLPLALPQEHPSGDREREPHPCSGECGGDFVARTRCHQEFRSAQSALSGLGKTYSSWTLATLPQPNQQYAPPITRASLLGSSGAGRRKLGSVWGGRKARYLPA